MHVLILDADLNQVSLLSHFVSLTFNQQFNTMGSFEIVENLNALNAHELKVGRIVYLDSARVGIIERVEISRDTNASGEIISASGMELKDIIKRRITVPPAASAHGTYTQQKTEAIVRDLLDKHIVNPVDNTRAIPIFTLGSNHDAGTPKDFSTRYKPLDEEIYNLLQENGLGLRCDVNLATKMASLEVRDGLNRTIDQSENPTAIFSLKLGTSKSQVILQDEQSWRNTAYVGGKGEGEERAMLTLPIVGAESGMARREVFVDARDAVTDEELSTRGNAKLAELGKAYTVNTTANETAEMDFDIGDWVSVVDYRSGDYENLQVTGMVDTYAGAAAKQCSIVFGRAPLTIGEAVNARMTGVNNILTQ